MDTENIVIDDSRQREAIKNRVAALPYFLPKLVPESILNTEKKNKTNVPPDR